MSYKLEKPYTDIEKADFIVFHNHNNGRNIEETENALYALEVNEIMVDGQPQINPNYEREQAILERERLDNLHVTRGDMFESLILAKGITQSQIRKMIENFDTDEQTKALYLNRFDNALEFYRGYPVFNLLGSEIGITQEQFDNFFATKDYKALITE